MTPKQLGASAYVGDAIRQARTTPPGRNVPLKVAAPLPSIDRYVRTLAHGSTALPSTRSLLLRDSRPFVTKNQDGRRLRQLLAAREYGPDQFGFGDVDADCGIADGLDCAERDMIAPPSCTALVPTRLPQARARVQRRSLHARLCSPG